MGPTRIGRWVAECELASGAVIPRGWGFCRPMLYSEDRCYIAPIPLNFIIGAAHWLYWRVLIRGIGFRNDSFEGLRCYWIQEGQRRGYNEGYETGFRHAIISAEGASKEAHHARRFEYPLDQHEIAYVDLAAAEARVAGTLSQDVEAPATGDPRPGDGDRGDAAAGAAEQACACHPDSPVHPCSGECRA